MFTPHLSLTFKLGSLTRQACLLIALCLCGSLNAQATAKSLKVGDTLPELASTDGSVWRTVTINGIEPDSITFTHQDGFGRISLAKLSPSLQQQFAYDEEKAARYRETKRLQEEQAYQKTSASTSAQSTNDLAFQKASEAANDRAEQINRERAELQAKLKATNDEMLRNREAEAEIEAQKRQEAADRMQERIKERQAAKKKKK